MATPVRKAALAFIFVTVVLDMLALGITIPVLPKLILEFKGRDSAQAAAVFGAFGTLFAAMQFFFAPVLGAVSDRFGRRPAILFSNFGLGLDYILMALAPSLAWLFVGRAISGICAASFSIPSAYIADVTTPEKRAAGYGLMGAAFGLGFVIGPAFGGLLGDMDPRLPFWVAAGLSLANALYGLFILPESLPPEKRAAFGWARANPAGSFLLLRKYPEVRIVAVVAFFSYLAHEVLPSMWVLYTDYRYHWSAKTVGLTLAVVGVFSALVQGGLIRKGVAYLGERRALLLGLFCGAAGFAVYGLAPTPAIFFLGIPFGALWGFAGPSAQAIMSQRVDPTEQGRLQGALAGLRGVSGMIGPAVFTAVFAWSIGPGAPRPMPGAPFLLAAILLSASLLIAFSAAGRPTETGPASRP
ncbi:MAG TPA: TCR/Tet family MFS transporter [Fibrobacteria bacterium]|nr:TCR/Tet family MFS transporter [Fibrobacteria bacterium]